MLCERACGTKRGQESATTYRSFVRQRSCISHEIPCGMGDSGICRKSGCATALIGTDHAQMPCEFCCRLHGDKETLRMIHPAPVTLHEVAWRPGVRDAHVADVQTVTSRLLAPLRIPHLRHRTWVIGDPPTALFDRPAFPRSYGQFLLDRQDEDRQIILCILCVIPHADLVVLPKQLGKVNDSVTGCTLHHAIEVATSIPLASIKCPHSFDG